MHRGRPALNDDMNRAVQMVSGLEECSVHLPCTMRTSSSARQLPHVLSECTHSCYALLRTLSQVANGMKPRTAWELCDEPGGEKAIQNIRKRGFAARAPGAANAIAVAVAVEVFDEQEPGSKERRRQETFRLNSDQVKKQETHAKSVKAQFDEVYAAATQEWSDMVAKGTNGKGDASADGVAARFRQQLPADCLYKLTGRSLKNALASGRAGTAPRPRNHRPAIPAAFVESVAQFAQLKQLNGDEQKPRFLVQAAVASAAGTVHEAHLTTQSQKQYLMKRVRKEMEMAVVTSKAIDDRRWQWLTSTNLTTWLKAYVESLVEWKYLPGVPDNIYEIMVIPEDKLAYMANGDESHQKLSNEGITAGPCSRVYINPHLARAGQRKVQYQKHATIWVWAAYSGEVGPVALMLATDAAEAKQHKAAAGSSTQDAAATNELLFVNRVGIRVRPEWMCGVPRVRGKFGCAETQTFEPIFLLNESGGTTGDSLEQLFEQGVLPCYLNLSPTWVYDSEGRIEKAPLHFQLDAGPGRYAESTLAWRASMWERGVALFPGLINGTAANQVLDDLFGLYKTSCNDVIDHIVSERITANQLDPTVKVNLDFSDLGRIINGRPEDPITARPFERAFTVEKIRNSTAKLGVAPVDLRRALDHPRVRDDSVDGSRSNHVVDLTTKNKQTLALVAEHGFNTAALQVPLIKDPSGAQAPIVAPPADWESRWKAVKAAGGSASAHWVAVGPRAFNAPDVVLPAMERVQDKIAAVQEREQLKEENLRELQDAAREIESNCEGDYGELSAADAKLLVSFIFKAKKLKGVGQYTANKAAAVDYLLEMDLNDFMNLLNEEYTSTAVPAAVAQPLLELTDESTPRAPRFDDDMVPSGMLTVAAPDWLKDALEIGNIAAKQLVGSYILYRWPDRLGGWLDGEITAINTDEKQTVKGGVMCNFVVHYKSDGETAHHTLTLKSYAKSCKSATDSWVLLEVSATPLALE